MLSDAAYMDRALFLAARALGCTTPNPMVGAVVVTPGGVVAGAGFHARAGAPHAEVYALRAAGGLARGSTLYCTLEPCCHHGRTPPCVDAVLEAGIARVVMAVADPNPRVAGGGERALRARGVRVDVGVGRDAAMRLNRPFFSAMRLHRPWVIAKTATSLDGRVAAAPGVRTALSSDQANRQSQMSRAEVDAVAVGSGTMLVDDPLLTCRDVYRARPLVRVIFDRRLRTPPSARVFSTLDAGPVLVVTSRAGAGAGPARASALEAAGATLVPLDEPALAPALHALLAFDVQSVLLEGGPALQHVAWDAGLIDAVRVIVTPRVLGPAGVPWIGSPRLSLTSLHDVRTVPCGPDVIIEGHVHRFD